MAKAGAASLVEYREHEDVVVFDPVEDVIRECSNPGHPEMSADSGRRFGVRHETLDHAFKLNEKAAPYPRPLFFVVAGCFLKIILSQQVEAKASHARAARILRRPSSPGTASAFPSR